VSRGAKRVGPASEQRYATDVPQKQTLGRVAQRALSARQASCVKKTSKVASSNEAPVGRKSRNAPLIVFRDGERVRFSRLYRRPLLGRHCSIV